MRYEIIISNNKVDEYIKKIHKEGGHCYIVGGYVRDFLLNKVSKDIDIEVYNISFERLKKIFGEDGNIQGNFGVIKLKGTEAEFTLPRKENKIGVRHGDFIMNFNPNMNLKEASIRRDFTMNAIMYDLQDKKIIDNYHGIKDLNGRVIRHISDKFSEDPLRVLRAIRFSYTLGFEIEYFTKLKCLSMLEELKYISPARKNQEINKLIDVAPNNFKIGMKNFVEIFLPYLKLEKLVNIKQNKKYHPEGTVLEHTKQCLYLVNLNKNYYTFEDYKVLFMTMLLHDIGKIEMTDEKLSAHGHEIESAKMAKPLLEDILINKKDIKLILSLIENHMIMHVIKEVRPSKILNLFNMYKEKFYILVEVGIIDECSRLKNYSDEEIKLKYETKKKEYMYLFNIYNKLQDFKKKYNGNYYISLGYTGSQIKDIQYNEQIHFLKKKLKEKY